MRTLKFIVEDQIIKPDPNCGFHDLVPGTKGYLMAEFSFSKEWNGYTKVAGFFSPMGREYKPQILKDGKTCVIPAEACARSQFKIQVLGKKGVDVLKTNKLGIHQTGGIII